MHLSSRRIGLCISCAMIILCALYFLNRTAGEKKYTLYGNVDVRQVDLSFEVTGRLKEMLFEEGDTIRAGDAVGTIDKTAYENRVIEAQSTLTSAICTLKNAEDVVRRRITIQKPGAISEEEYGAAVSSRDIAAAKVQEAEASLRIAQKNLADTTLFAPRDGTILTRVCEPGTVLSPSMPVYTLSATSPVCVRAYISEPELGCIFPGMPVQIFTDAPEGKGYKGHIGFISPVAEFTPKTVQTTSLRAELVYRIRIIVDDADCLLKQGMPVTLTIENNKGQS